MGIIEAILKIIPQIIQAIHFAEVLFPSTGSGAQKLDYVATTAGKVAAAIPEVAGQAAQLVESVKPVINTVVGALNALGVLKGPATLAAQAVDGIDDALKQLAAQTGSPA